VAIDAASSGFDATAEAESIQIRPDGRILVAGWGNAGDHGGCPSFTILGVLADGTPDPAWGASGLVDATPECSYLRDAVLGADGSLTAVGEAFNYFEPELPFPIVRYGTTGALDATFGGDGIVADRFVAGDPSSAFAVVTSSHRTLVAGVVSAPSCPIGRRGSESCRAFALKAYDGAGEVDPDFGSNGIVTVPAVAPLSYKPVGRLARRALPDSIAVTAKHEARLRLTCPDEFVDSCHYLATIRVGSRGRPVASFDIELDRGYSNRIPLFLAADGARRLERAGEVYLSGTVTTGGRSVSLRHDLRVRTGS
jgi:uncharacterized delta-60 repeat protein